MTLGEKILSCRKRLGLSQEALAERLGVSRQAVSKWETGEAVPELGKLTLLAKTFGVTTDWLLSDEEPQPERAESKPVPPEARQNAYPSWLEHLPGFLLRMIKRYGWLYGARIAIGGALFVGIGLIGRIITKQMLSGFGQMTNQMISDFGQAFPSNGMGFDPFGSFESAVSNAAANNPVYTMCGFILGLGVIGMIAGIVLAIVLKRYGRDK